MIARYHAMTTGKRLCVIAVLAVLGFLAADEYSWSLARKWASEGDAIETVLRRSGKARDLVNSDLRRAVATYGPVVPPQLGDEGGESMTRAVEDILNKFKVTGLSFDRRSGQRMRDQDTEQFGSNGLDRSQADVKFETTAEDLPKILAALEGDERIAAVTSLRIQGASQSASRRLNVQATIEAWVQAGRSRSRR